MVFKETDHGAQSEVHEAVQPIGTRFDHIRQILESSPFVPGDRPTHQQRQLNGVTQAVGLR